MAVWSDFFSLVGFCVIYYSDLHCIINYDDYSNVIMTIFIMQTSISRTCHHHPHNDVRPYVDLHRNVTIVSECLVNCPIFAKNSTPQFPVL